MRTASPLLRTDQQQSPSSHLPLTSHSDPVEHSRRCLTFVACLHLTFWLRCDPREVWMADFFLEYRSGGSAVFIFIFSLLTLLCCGTSYLTRGSTSFLERFKWASLSLDVTIAQSRTCSTRPYSLQRREILKLNAVRVAMGCDWFQAIPLFGIV
jgi:hypothetical protein